LHMIGTFTSGVSWRSTDYHGMDYSCLCMVLLL